MMPERMSTIQGTIQPRLVKAMAIDIEPEDVRLSDTATFIWALA